MQLHLSIQCMFSRLEEFKDTKGKSKDRQHNGQKKKGQKSICKSLHVNRKIE